MVTNKDLIIRSSSAEFLIFERQKKEKGIQVRFEHGDLWLTQKAVSELYDCSIDNVSLHLKNIYNDMELDKNSTIEEFSIVQKEGNRNVTRNIKYYNLDAVISVGYRVNSDRAINNIPMTMEDWANRIDKYLLSDDLDVLKDAGKISHEIAEEKALSEFEKYRIIQDRKFESDFDKFILEAKGNN